MSLQLKISAKEFKNSFAIYDCTGSYSSGSNKGGWGNPNPKIENVTDAYFEITPPNGVTPYKVTVYSTFPTTDCDTGYEITPTMVGMTYIESGTWKIAYFVLGTDSNGASYTKKTVILKVFVNSARCCVDTMLKNVSADAFSNKKQTLATELNALLDSVERTKECFPTESQNILEYINLQCACCGCV